MTKVSRAAIMQSALDRRERVKELMMQEPPPSFKTIMQMEGMNYRSLRVICKEIEEANPEIKYLGQNFKTNPNEMPFGLTPATLRLRQKLGDQLYFLLERGQESSNIARNAAAAKVGLNNREQIRAEQRPFNHDWTLSQIERLATQLNRDPREFLLACLTA